MIRRSASLVRHCRGYRISASVSGGIHRAAVLRILAALTIDSGTASADAQHTIMGLVERRGLRSVLKADRVQIYNVSRSRVARSPALPPSYLRDSSGLPIAGRFQGDHSSAGGRAHGFASIGCQGREDQLPMGVG